MPLFPVDASMCVRPSSSALLGTTDAPKESELGETERADSPLQSEVKPQASDRSRKTEKRQFPSFFGASAATLGISITASDGPKEEPLDLVVPADGEPPPSTSRVSPIEPAVDDEITREVKRERTTERVTTSEAPATPALISPMPDIPIISQQDETIPFTEIPELVPQASFQFDISIRTFKKIVTLRSQRHPLRPNRGLL